MYAETFDVRPWLEPAAKWLRWAMQSTQARKLDDAQYNLNQFWKSLESFKGRARTSQDWAEILTLDAQSQWAYSNYCQARQSQIMAATNDYGTAKKSFGLLAPSNWIEWATGQNDPQLDRYAAQVKEYGRQAEQANATAETLAQQAADASRKAQVKTQAENTVTVTSRNAPRVKSENAAKDRVETWMRDEANKSPNPFTFELWGLPVWAWGAIAIGGILLLTPAPPVLSLATSGSRR